MLIDERMGCTPYLYLVLSTMTSCIVACKRSTCTSTRYLYLVLVRPECGWYSYAVRTTGRTGGKRHSRQRHPHLPAEPINGHQRAGDRLENRQHRENDADQERKESQQRPDDVEVRHIEEHQSADD